MGDYIIMNGELYHWGIKGMRWGVRRYQNADGTLTEAGKRRYYNEDGSYTEAGKQRNFEAIKKHAKNNRGTGSIGITVGTDPDITALADKVAAVQGAREEALRRKAAVRREQEREDYKKYETFLKKYGRDPSEKEEQKMHQETYRKYKKDIEITEREAKKRIAESDAVIKQVIDDYLGKYGDRPARSSGGITARRWLEIEIDWGNATRNFRLGNQ